MTECQRLWDDMIMSNHGREAEYWLEYANILRSVVANSGFNVGQQDPTLANIVAVLGVGPKGLHPLFVTKMYTAVSGKVVLKKQKVTR